MKKSPARTAPKPSPGPSIENLDDTDVATVFQRFRDEVDTCREATTRYDSLDYLTTPGDTISLRWIYTHLVEEYARHNGHADLLREAIDGARRWPAVLRRRGCAGGWSRGRSWA